MDCLWLPPVFKSPLRDGGYDVSDYTAVLPEFGDLADFVEFVDAAHQRGMRVIIDFVMNHTSDQHEWFQQSRTDPDGPYGDYYVWADDDKQCQDARIIFVDTETSNWTFDPVRKQYYWHRFFCTSRTSTTRTRRSRRRSWRPCGSGWSWAPRAGAGSTRRPTSPGARARLREPPGPHALPQAGREEFDAVYLDAVSAPRPTRGRRTP
ncbi:hypothetical protein SBADM41S_03450 [Streptomyces badius]